MTCIEDPLQNLQNDLPLLLIYSVLPLMQAANIHEIQLVEVGHIYVYIYTHTKGTNGSHYGALP
jgi:hypothetical protein